MTRSKKLLSLIVTATAATAAGACAGSRTAAPQAPRAPVAARVEVRAVSTAAEMPAPAIDTVTPLAAGTVVDTPLVGANGRPACGNVQTKSDESMSVCQ